MNYHKIARKVWTEMNGEILKGYCIHHIDHNPENNDISNLQYMSDEDHKEYHSNSPLTFARRSAANTGENHPLFNKGHSQDTKDKMSDHWSGKTGLKSNSYNHIIHHFIHKDGTERKCTQYSLRTEFDLGQSSLSSVVRGKRNHHKGWKLIQGEQK